MAIVAGMHTVHHGMILFIKFYSYLVSHGNGGT